MPPVLERHRPSARLFFIHRKPDKVVKVDELRGLGGDGMHAEELLLILTAGQGGWVGAAEEERRRTEREKEGEGGVVIMQ